MKSHTQFAQNLRHFMKLRRYGVTALAKEIGVGRQAVYGWLKGGGISDELLAAVARVLETDPAELKYGAEGARPEAAAEPPPGPAEGRAGAVDQERLKGVLLGVERALAEAQVTLPVDKKAEVVALLYRLETSGGPRVSPDIVRSLVTLTTPSG